MSLATDAGDSRTTVTTKFTDKEKQRINEIAYELSEPGDTVDAAQVVREAVRDYIKKFEKEPEDCCPRERGNIDGVAEA